MLLLQLQLLLLLLPLLLQLPLLSIPLFCSVNQMRNELFI